MVDYTKPIIESNNFIVLDKYAQNWQIAEKYQSEDELREQRCEFFRNLLLSFPTYETAATA